MGKESRGGCPKDGVDLAPSAKSPRLTALDWALHSFGGDWPASRFPNDGQLQTVPRRYEWIRRKG